MRRIAAEIREETGLTCSVGISENRLLAKITSELGKPAGLVVLSRRKRWSASPASRRASSRGSARRPWSSCSGWASAPWPSCARTTRRSSSGSGHAGAGWLQARARFEDETPITVVHETKSQSAETTFDVDVADQDEMAARIASLAKELCRRLRSRDLDGRTIGIKVRLDDWTNVTRSHTVEEPTNDPAWSRRSPSTCCAPTPRPAPCDCSASGSPRSSSAKPREQARQGSRISCASRLPSNGAACASAKMSRG